MIKIWKNSVFFLKFFAVFSREILQLFFAKWFSFIASERKAKCDFFIKNAKFLRNDFPFSLETYISRTNIVAYIFVSLSVNSSFWSQKSQITSRWNELFKIKKLAKLRNNFIFTCFKNLLKKISENLFEFWCFC